MKLTIDGPWFVDEIKRRWLLRGINFGGNAKRPFGTTMLDPLSPSAEISFVGRPVPIAEADTHFRRLRHWGFNTIRFLTTWEAIEPYQPKSYDERYLDYFSEMVKRAGQHGFFVFIDPHQDAWSRWSGGDGAPAWTLELAGFNLAALDESEAAITLPARYPNYQRMTWPNNWNRLAAATMFTLFFGGRRFAPKLKIDGQFADDFFQNHFINAIEQIANRISHLPHVLGYDSLNEPSAGYLGIKDLNLTRPVYNSGPELTAFESIYIPSGFTLGAQEVRRGGLNTTSVPGAGKVLNGGRSLAWKDEAHDLWRNHGLWDLDADGRPELLLKDYFGDIHFSKDCLSPFAHRYATALRKIHPDAFLFIEDQPGYEEPFPWKHDIPVVNANHWYDVLTLITRHYNPHEALTWSNVKPVLGQSAVRQSFREQIGANVSFSKTLNCPTLIGEFGVPFDLDDGKSFLNGDYSDQEQALTQYYNALDHWLAHSALWNYTADNTHDTGDHWNLEDLSIFSVTDQTDPANIHSGGRAVRGFSRPCVHACAGTPISQTFDSEKVFYELTIESDPSVPDPSLIFIPDIWFSARAEIKVSGGNFVRKGNWIFWHAAGHGRQSLQILES